MQNGSSHELLTVLLIAHGLFNNLCAYVLSSTALCIPTDPEAPAMWQERLARLYAHLWSDPTYDATSSRMLLSWLLGTFGGLRLMAALFPALTPCAIYAYAMECLWLCTEVRFSMH